MDPLKRNEILEMLAAGKISAAEAIDLLDGRPSKPTEPEPAASVESLKSAETIPAADDMIAVEEVKSGATDSFKGLTLTREEVLSSTKNGQRPRWLKIRVRELETGRNKVSVTLPLGIVNFGLGIARRFGADFDEAGNIDEMWEMIRSGERGVLVDVEDEEDNEHVQIYLD